MHYKRILLKLSGEILTGQNVCLCKNSLNTISTEIVTAYNQGYEIGLVIGGGNIYRGARSNLQIDRISGDYIGMAATMVNAIALQGYLQNLGAKVRVYSAIQMERVIKKFDRQNVLRDISNGCIVIFASGTGHPLFTTDTAAVLRAVECGCNVVLKGTHVDGIYDSDPLKNTDAKRYTYVNYATAIEKNLKIADITAISLAMENNMPIIVFNIHKQGELLNVLRGKGNFSILSNDGDRSNNTEI